jgi:hypothetical protein
LGSKDRAFGAGVRSAGFSRSFYSNDGCESTEQKCKSGARKLQAPNAFGRFTVS